MLWGPLTALVRDGIVELEQLRVPEGPAVDGHQTLC